MFACSSHSGKECKSCYTSFSSWWGCSGSTHQLGGTVHFNYPAERHTCLGCVRIQCQQSPLYPQHWNKYKHPCADWLSHCGLLHHQLCDLSCSPFLESFILAYPIASDSVRQMGVRDKLQIDSRSLWRLVQIGICCRLSSGLLVAALGRECSKQSISSTLFHCFRGLQSDPFSKLHTQWKQFHFQSMFLFLESQGS